MKYDSQTVLRKIPEFIQLKNSKKKYSGPLAHYNDKTIEEFINDYKNKELKGKEVYDAFILLIAPEEYKGERKGPEIKIKVLPAKPERYSIEDLMSQKTRILPYVSNVRQSIGKLMDCVINQTCEILNRTPSPVCQKYGDTLRFFFVDHKAVDEIVNIIKDSKENIQGMILRKFMRGDDFPANIIISDDFKKNVKTFIRALLYKPCDSAFEDNDINTDEKIEFALKLSGYSMLEMNEWGNMRIVIETSTKSNTRKHLISLKKAICDAIVPVQLQTLIELTRKDFVKKNNAEEFNSHIIESFVESNPWIKIDDEGRYYILTQHLTFTHQRQGRIIYEAGGLIHHKEVKAIYESIYHESYQTPGIQPTLSDRVENDFFAYGKTGSWYYSKDHTHLPQTNDVLTKFIDEHVCFHWQDLADVVSHLCKVNKKLNVRLIRLQITNLCYVDNNDKNHFVKKGEEEKYATFSWNKGKQSRTNWVVNHIYEILKEKPKGEMEWRELQKILKQDLQETGRPLAVINDVKYKLSGSATERYIFILENDIIRINEDVLQNEYDGNLSMYGIYRKYSEFYSIIFSLAMTELRKQHEQKMPLVDFIDLALKTIEREEDSGLNDRYIRHIFSDNDNLPAELSRYNENGRVFIKYNPAEANAETKENLQFVVSAKPSNEDQTTPELHISEDQRQPVTYATRYNWDDVKRALKADLAFYNSPFWYLGITSDDKLNKFVRVLSNSRNNNLNDLVPQIIYEFHYARIDRYDLNQYMRNLPIAFEALLREIYESTHCPTRTNGIKNLCEIGFTEFNEALTRHEKKGFGRILNDLVNKRNLLLHGANLELSPVTLVQNIVEYIALFVYTVDKYSLDT